MQHLKFRSFECFVFFLFFLSDHQTSQKCCYLFDVFPPRIVIVPIVLYTPPVSSSDHGFTSALSLSLSLLPRRITTFTAITLDHTRENRLSSPSTVLVSTRGVRDFMCTGPMTTIQRSHKVPREVNCASNAAARETDREQRIYAHK